MNEPKATQAGRETRCWQRDQTLAERPDAGRETRCWQRDQMLAERDQMLAERDQRLFQEAGLTKCETNMNSELIYPKMGNSDFSVPGGYSRFNKL